MAYADFVTAMMALFMVLWLVSQTDASTKSEISTYFRTGVFGGTPHPLEGGAGLQAASAASARAQNAEWRPETQAENVKAALAQAAEESPDIKALQEHIEVKVVDDGLLIEIADGTDDLLFDLSSANLKGPLVHLLETLGPALGRVPNSIRLIGHTDGRQFARDSGRSNWQLSFERADAARMLLEQHGLRPGQVTGVVASGDTHVANPSDPFSPENRRLSILAVRRGHDAQPGAPSEPHSAAEEAPVGESPAESPSGDAEAHTEAAPDSEDPSAHEEASAEDAPHSEEVSAGEGHDPHASRHGEEEVHPGES